MKLLFLGDVVGKPGRDAVARLLPGLRRQYQADFVIANGENAAHGAGLTVGTCQELLVAGVNVITGGDHMWDQKGFENEIDRLPQVLRPLNWSNAAPGKGSVVLPVGEKASVGVISLMGRTYMRPCDDPFRTVRQEVERLRRQTPIIVVDIHAEATSEKVALGWYLDGQVSLVVGTHTHVQTSDEQILPKGTAYLTDAGMCGPHESVLGRQVEAVVQRFVTGMPQKLEVASGRVELCGVVVEVEETSGRALAVQRLRVPA